MRQYNTDEESSIDIEFHDTSTHHAMHVANTMNHMMGDLSVQAAILACESSYDSPSKIVCMHFSSWDNVKEWSVPMPDNEEIMVRMYKEKIGIRLSFGSNHIFTRTIN